MLVKLHHSPATPVSEFDYFGLKGSREPSVCGYKPIFS